MADGAQLRVVLHTYPSDLLLYSTLEDQDEENTPDTKEKQQIQSKSSEANQNYTTQDRRHRDESHSSGQSPYQQSDLTFNWESAPTTMFRDVGGMDSLKRNIMRSFFARSHTLMPPTSGSTSHHQTASSCMARRYRKNTLRSSDCW